ncbi:MAG: sensor histidine kinase [Promethearchaeota archaeon]
MLEETIIDLIIAGYTISTSLIFGISTYTRRDLLIWFIGSINFSIGAVFIYLRVINVIYRLVGDLFYFFAIITFIYAVFNDYYKVFFKHEGLFKKNKGKENPIYLSISFTALLISIQMLVGILLILVIVMLLKLYLKQRSITHLVMFFTIASGLLTIISTILENILITGAWELSYVGNIITVTFLLATALAGPIEDRIRKSEKRFRGAFNRAEFYKDLFAHDISNILQNIKTSLELALKWHPLDEKKEEIDRLFSIMDEQVIRGSKLIENICKFSQVEEEVPHLEKVDLITYLTNSIKYANDNYPKKEKEIQKNYDYTELYVKANVLLLDVFENILMNAVKYNDKSRIEISINITKVRKNEIGYAKIEIKDNVFGISDEMKKIIFKSVIKNRQKVKGMGLGLLLVKKIIDIYNGEIWVEDRIKGDPSKGSNFIILIPEVL